MMCYDALLYFLAVIFVELLIVNSPIFLSLLSYVRKLTSRLTSVYRNVLALFNSYLPFCNFVFIKLGTIVY